MSVRGCRYFAKEAKKTAGYKAGGSTTRPNRDKTVGPNRKKERPPELTMREIVAQERINTRDFRIDHSMLPLRAYVPPMRDNTVPRQKLKRLPRKCAHMLSLLEMEQVTRMQKEKASHIAPFKAGDTVEIGVRLG